MQIKKVSCEQFAGLLDFEAEFKDGINVLQGKNESGKSTVVNLLSRTLFQDSKIDRRSNKEFMDNFFPVARKNGGRAGDFIDGKVVFETKILSEAHTRIPPRNIGHIKEKKERGRSYFCRSSLML